MSGFTPRGENNFTSGKSWDEKLADPGAFQYTEDGFICTYEGFTKSLKWSEITELNIYVHFAGNQFEETTMEIVYGDKYFKITEALPGWYQFVTRTKVVFPSIPKDWDMDINDPIGATNYRTIYKKETKDL